MSRYISAGEARKVLGVTDDTLRRWVREKKIEAIRAPGNRTHHRYDITSFLQQKPQRKIVYARISSYGQRPELGHQLQLLQESYPEHEVLWDIGSGLNFKRKGFLTLLESALQHNLAEVVVTYRDRLCRFGFELVESLIKRGGGKVTVLCSNQHSPEEELVQDLLAIITVFAARVHGLRRYHGAIKTQFKGSSAPTDPNTTSSSR